MSDNHSSIAPKWFLIVGIVALIWNLMGVAAYVMQVMMTPQDLAALPEAQRAVYEVTPAWATAAFAIAVNFGALGCLLLILKRKLAFPVLLLSLLGVVAQMTYVFLLSNSFEVFGPGGMIMPFMVLVVAIYLVTLARSATTKGWLK